MLPGIKQNLHQKSRGVVEARLAALGCSLLDERRVPHEVSTLAGALTGLLELGAEMLLVLGATATVDRRDVVPGAIERAGGAIGHFGMPADPGNLLLLAHYGGIPVVGLPGCARSPMQNGFDWVLQRLVAGIVVTPGDIMRMGAGGLLKKSDAYTPHRAGRLFNA